MLWWRVRQASIPHHGWVRTQDMRILCMEGRVHPVLLKRLLLQLESLIARCWVNTLHRRHNEQLSYILSQRAEWKISHRFHSHKEYQECLLICSHCQASLRSYRRGRQSIIGIYGVLGANSCQECGLTSEVVSSRIVENTRARHSDRECLQPIRLKREVWLCIASHLKWASTIIV